MVQYIPKDALMAEIENYKNSIGEDGENCNLVVGRHEGQKMASEHFLSFLNTFEVKEVDLEKEIEKEIEYNYNPMDGLSFEEFRRIAKHFFELGLNAKRGA